MTIRSGTIEFLGLYVWPDEGDPLEETGLDVENLACWRNAILTCCAGVAVYDIHLTWDNDREFHQRLAQPFAQAPYHEAAEGFNVWQWDGDEEAPTLHPSLGWWAVGEGRVVHLFLKNGKIEPCNDMLLDVVGE